MKQPSGPGDRFGRVGGYMVPGCAFLYWRAKRGACGRRARLREDGEGERGRFPSSPWPRPLCGLADQPRGDRSGNFFFFFWAKCRASLRATGFLGSTATSKLVGGRAGARQRNWQSVAEFQGDRMGDITAAITHGIATAKIGTKKPGWCRHRPHESDHPMRPVTSRAISSSIPGESLEGSKNAERSCWRRPRPQKTAAAAPRVTYTIWVRANGREAARY